LAVLVALLMMRLPQTLQEVRTDPLTVQIAAGFRYILENPPVRTMIMLVGVSSLFGFSYAVLMPAYAVDVLHVGEAGLGGLNVAIGVGALAGSLIVASMGKLRRKGLLLTMGSLLFPTVLLLFAFSQSFALSLVALSIVGLAYEGWISQD
jgi:predicted MFS family arabinose efflux permease